MSGNGRSRSLAGPLGLILLGLILRGHAGAVSRTDAAARDDAERLITQAEDLSYRGGYTLALAKADRALALSQALDDRRLLARSLDVKGALMHRQGDGSAGADLHRRALEIARAIPDRTLEGSILASVGAGFWRQGQYGEALESLERALAMQEEIRDSPGSAKTLSWIGRVSFKRGEYGRAAEFHLRALAIREELSDGRGRSESLEDLGDILQEQGAYGQALSRYEMALRVREEMGDRAGQAYMLSIVGRCFMLQGANRQALAWFHRARDLARQGDDTPGLAAAFHHMGIAYGRLGDGSRALESYGAALKATAAMGDRRESAWILSRMGDIERLRGDLASALASYRRAVAIWEEIGEPRGLAGGLEKSALVYSALGYYDRSLALYERAARLREESQPAFLPATLFEIARVLASRGDGERAIECAERALSLARASDSLEVRWKAFHAHASLERRLNRPLEALESYRASVELLEQLRAALTPADETKAGFLDSKQVVYAEAISLLMELGRVEEALEMAERSRARAFLDLLGSRENKPGPEEARIVETRPEASELRGGKAREETGLAVVDADVLRGHDRDRDEFKRFAVRKPGPSSLLAIDAPTLAQMKDEARGRHTAVLEYFAADEVLFTWLVGPDGSVRSARSEISRRELSELASKMRGAARTPGSRALARSASRRLHQLLIAPIDEFLPEDPEEIVTIVPHGPLFLVSFAALEDRQGSYLVERHTIAYSPSVGVLRYTEKSRHPAPGPDAPRVLLVGNPRMPELPRIALPPLPGAEREARAIGRLFPANQVTILTGARAAEPVIRRLAPAQRVIHLATHARVYDDEPLESFLTLASSPGAPARRGRLGGSDRDGFWTVREVLELELHSDLVTLSACDTGLGRVTGDGVIGLSRAFLYAGTPSVLVSLWQVADILAGPQMEAFYRELRDNGGNKAAALRTAQLTTRRGLRQGRFKTRSGAPLPDDPIYWAPFVLIGEAR